MAKALIGLAPSSLALVLVSIGELPLYNEDLEANFPAPWKLFREQIRNFDGVLFVTLEYNRSVPASLKNAIDVGSRPYAKAPGRSIRFWNLERTVPNCTILIH